MSAFIIFGILIGFIFLGVPVCFSIAYSGIGYILSSQAQPLILIAQRSLNGMDNYTLLAIPLFTLAGFIMDMVIIIVGMSAILSWILSATGIPAQIAAKVVPFLGNQYVYIIVLLIILFIIGCLMETVASMLILGPILVPIGLELGVNELHLSMIFCLALIVGMVTPPFGLNLFTACATTGQSFMQVVKGMVPYMVALIIAVIIVSFVPELALFLPHITGVT